MSCELSSFSSSDEILLDIFSPNYPDLQFVDLPGFTRTTVAGQNEGIVQQIEELNLKYMRDTNTIILAIQDGTQDIANSEALNKALSVDPEGKRTVGVLTKLDLLQRPEDKEKVARVLENKTKPLQLGYFGVISAKDPSHSLAALLADPAFQAYIQDSHWSSSYNAALLLVESFIVLLRQLSYAIKNQLVASKAPY